MTENGIAVSLSSSDSINLDPKETNEYLSKLLNDRNLEGFKQALEFIGFVDKFQELSSVDPFNCLTQIENALAFIFKTELEANDIQKVIMSGHGFPTVFEHNLGPCLTYFVDPDLLKDVDFEPGNLDTKNSWIAKITLEPSKLTHFLPKSRTQTCFEAKAVIKLTSTEKLVCEVQEMEVLGNMIATLVPTCKTKLAAHATFVLQLAPSVQCTTAVAKQLQAVANGRPLQRVILAQEGYTGLTFEASLVRAL